MVKPKQKWTLEEEEALSAGVDLYGLGRWKSILSDPQFASPLANRSNVDLKDKWRNLSGGDYGSSNSKGNVKTQRIQDINNILLTSPEPSKSSVVKRRVLPYKAMISEALSSFDDPNGTDVNSIVKFLEPKYDVAKNFRRILTVKLRKLVLSGDLEKVGHCYKIKNMSSDTETSQLVNVQTDNVDNCNEEQREPLPTETAEDAALFAAFKVYEAEKKEEQLVVACEDADKLAELLEDSIVMIRLAEDLHEQCERDEPIILLA